MNQQAATLSSTGHNMSDYRPAGQLLRRLSFALLVLAILSISGTYITITQGEKPLGSDSHIVQILTIINLALVIGLIIVIGYRLLRLWSSLREGSAGSRLQTRIITVFGIATILPTILVSVFTAILLNYGIKSWFDERVSTALEESVAVAESYLAEHQETIRADALAMAADIRRELHTAIINPAFFNNIINGQVALRSLAEAVVIQQNTIIGRSSLSFSLTFERLPEELLERARDNQIVLLEDEDKISALILVDAPTNTYLIVSRLIDSKVLNYMEKTQGAVHEYKRLKSQISDLQIQFSVAFVIVSVLLLLTVIWYGIIFASRLAGPLSRLIKATEHVRAGDFSIHVEPGREHDEITLLIQRFNRMTKQLQAQRSDLTLANRTMDARRRFTEAVLEGASAGVLALDPRQHITLYNRSAITLLQLDERDEQNEIKGQPVTHLLPQITYLLQQTTEKPEQLHQGDITLTDEEQSQSMTLHVRVTAQHQEERIEGYIVTFDDISALVSAQRRAAWSDVARRIAHEIKNPLTPIRLSTERLRKRHTPEDEENRTSFLKYLEMINKHVRDIGSMVEEFVSFARMPQPSFKKEDLTEIIQRTVFSAQTGFPDIEITIEDNNDHPATVICDERQISQVFTNTLKNAAEALERRQEEQEEAIDEKAYIRLTLTQEDGQGNKHYSVRIMDNGTGFPPDQIDRMTEPYITTRAKGTGLGLAIVKKIMEDHDGSIQLENRPEGGACITLTFPLPAAGQESPKE